MIQRNGPAKQDHFFGLFEVHSSFIPYNFALMTNLLKPEYRKWLYPVVVLIAILGTCFSCKPEKTGEDPIFRKLSSRKTNITFQNTLTETDTFNYFLVFLHVYGRWGIRW